MTRFQNGVHSRLLPLTNNNNNKKKKIQNKNHFLQVRRKNIQIACFKNDKVFFCYCKNVIGHVIYQKLYIYGYFHLHSIKMWFLYRDSVTIEVRNYKFFCLYSSLIVLVLFFINLFYFFQIAIEIFKGLPSLKSARTSEN